MSKHLGKIIVDDIALPCEVFCRIGSETLTDRVKNISLYFNEIDTPVNLVQISKFELLPNNHIFIEGCLFSPSLYNSYVEHYTIKRLIENGLCTNPVDHNKYRDYVAEYYNYQFKEFSFSRTENTYSFILEPIEED